MKKITFILVAVLVLGSLLFVNTRVSALTLVESSDSLVSAALGIAERVATLERQVTELFDQIAHIKLVPGPQGPQGINGIDGISGWEKIQGAVVQSPNGWVITAVAECPAGKKVLGGGYTINIDGGTVQTLSNEPVSDTSWQVRIVGNIPFSAQAFALCASVRP